MRDDLVFAIRVHFVSQIWVGEGISWSCVAWSNKYLILK